nr:helix-turn-helix transcriptional regulator [Rhizobium sp. L1K21]
MMRRMRKERGISQKQMAQAIGVSPAYLSALEHGNRGAPSFDFVQRVAGFFGVIWDDAEELMNIAARSHPRIVVDTSGLEAEYTMFANRLSEEMRHLTREELMEMVSILDKARARKKAAP